MMSQCDDKPGELTVMALARARYCQLMAERERRDDPASYFTLGLLSVLDALMDSPMKDLLEGISAPPEFHAVLIEGRGRAGELLASVRYLESGRGLHDGGDGLGIDGDMLEAFQKAVMWAEGTRRSMSETAWAPASPRY